MQIWIRIGKSSRRRGLAGHRIPGRHVEWLEDRRLLAVGEFLGTIANPATSLQPGVESGSVVSAAGNWIAVSAPLADAAGRPGVGQVHLYDAASGLFQRTITNPVAESGGGFGISMSLSGNLLAVGAPDSSIGASSSGVVHLFDVTSGTLMRTIVNPTPASFDSFGQAVSLLGSRLVVGAYLDDTTALDAGQAYMFDVASGSVLQTFSPPSPSLLGYFGFSVAMSESTVAVGASRIDSGATDSGSVYLFDATTGSLVRTITNPTPANFDYFGHAIAISGNTLVVGAYRDGTGATSAGSAYVYDVRFEPLQFTINNPAPAFADFFAGSVAVDGDHIVFGARRADRSSFIDTGIAYQFSASTGLLVRTHQNPFPNALDYFGVAVAVSGDSVVIGAYRDDTAALDAGTSYIYHTATGQMAHVLFSPTLASYEYFGNAVAVDGDTVIVGAPSDDAMAIDAGAIDIFNARTGARLQTLVSPDAEAYANFGHSVALSGNLLVIGAYRQDSGNVTDVGAAYVFDIVTGMLVTRLVNPHPDAFDYFGFSVAIADGRVAVGAYLDDTAADDAGIVYLFDASTGLLLGELVDATPLSFAQFGYSVAMTNELLTVGIRSDSTLAEKAGSVHVYDVITNELVREIANPSPTGFDYFGHAVDVAEGRIAVGAPGKEFGAEDSGAAFLFQSNTGQLIQTFVNTDPEAGELLGASLSLSNRYLAVGAYGRKQAGLPNAGGGYLYDVASGMTTATLVADTVAVGDHYGWSVAVGVDFAVVGAPGTDGSTVDRGAVHLYDVHVNLPPVAQPGSPYVGFEGIPFSLDASTSFDLEDPLASLSFAWDLDYDGNTFQIDAVGVEPLVSISQAFSARAIAVCVTDSSGAKSIGVTTLTVLDRAPILTVNNSSITVLEGSAATNSGTVSHPLGEAITLTASVGTVIKNGDGTWNWSYTPPTAVPVLHVVTITSTDSSEISRNVGFELTVQTQTPVLPGDLNGDAIVDGLDASVLYDNWGGPGSGDVDNNGTIDGADLAILFSNWTGDSAVAARIDSSADDLVSSNLTAVRPDGPGIE
ncbi:MAG: hypothetical protein O3C60_08570 [Planctomycetota bacterium]|nr:hypothetical protein [Planctomycetota bacterium]